MATVELMEVAYGAVHAQLKRVMRRNCTYEEVGEYFAQYCKALDRQSALNKDGSPKYSQCVNCDDDFCEHDGDGCQCFGY